jgi:hypothetical protein
MHRHHAAPTASGRTQTQTPLGAPVQTRCQSWPSARTTDAKPLHPVKRCPACTQVKSRCDAFLPACPPKMHKKNSMPDGCTYFTSNHTVLLLRCAAKLAAAPTPGLIISSRLQRWQPSAKRPCQNHVNTQPAQHTLWPLVAPNSCMSENAPALPCDPQLRALRTHRTAVRLSPMQRHHSPHVLDSHK